MRVKCSSCGVERVVSNMTFPWHLWCDCCPKYGNWVTMNPICESKCAVHCGTSDKQPSLVAGAMGSDGRVRPMRHPEPEPDVLLPKCGNCRYWLIECRRFPTWVSRRVTGWCGEYKRKESS